MNPKIISVLLVGLLAGCQSNPPRVKDYDPEIDGAKFDRRMSGLDTSSSIISGDYEGIKVEVLQTGKFYDEQLKVERQKWSVNLTNSNREPKCVNVTWRLMDFEFISSHPSNIFIDPMTTMYVGSMIQNAWQIDGVVVTPPPSGYVQNMTVFDPDTSKRAGDQCLAMVEEEDVVEDKGVIESKEDAPAPHNQRKVVPSTKYYFGDDYRQQPEYEHYTPTPEYDQYPPKKVYYIPADRPITPSNKEAWRVLENNPSMIRVHNP